jgi:hypothetical protein
MQATLKAFKSFFIDQKSVIITPIATHRWIENMLFFHIMLFFFFTVQSSGDLQIDHDMSNPYGGKSFPSDYKKIRICFNKPDFLLKGSQTITITPDQKVFEDQNALNSIIHTYLVKNNRPQYGIVYLSIPSITDIYSTKCSILENRRAIDAIEQITKLNTEVKCTIENQKLKDPFKLSENSDAYIYVHTRQILLKIQPYAIGLGIASTLLRFLLPSKQIPSLVPIIVFFTPHLLNFKYVKYCVKALMTDSTLSSLQKLFIGAFFFLLPIIVFHGINRFI